MITDSLKSVLGNTKLIVKSVLDLVPAVIVAVIVAIIAGYGMNSLNNNFEKILDNQSKLVSVLKSKHLAVFAVSSLSICITNEFADSGFPAAIIF